MPKRSSKDRPPADENEAAARLIRLVTDDEPVALEPPVAPPAPARPNAKRNPPPAEKNPAAVALGQLGGRKGGKARAESLTPERRSEIARKAAAGRWARKNGGR